LFSYPLRARNFDCKKEKLEAKFETANILFLYGCETWSLTLREKHRLRVFENRVLRRIFGPKGMRWLENGENCITRSFVICTLRQV
jgi:hypothetical protein